MGVRLFIGVWQWKGKLAIWIGLQFAGRQVTYCEWNKRPTASVLSVSMLMNKCEGHILVVSMVKQDHQFI